MKNELGSDLLAAYIDEIMYLENFKQLSTLDSVARTIIDQRISRLEGLALATMQD